MTRIFLVSLGILSLLACQSTDRDTTLTIATAANMQFAMAQIAEAFTRQTNTPCDLIISSSGKLTAQIKEGAPYDVFVSANMKYPQEVYQSGLGLHPPSVYALGQLVLWTLDPNRKPTLDHLQHEDIRHIALANPQTAPYGQAAQECLQNQGLWDILADKLVYGESIAQTNQFITSRAAEMGFTAKSVVLSPSMQGQGVWSEVPASCYTPIEQGIVLIRREKALPAAQEFFTFIFSEKAKQIFRDFGYTVSD